MAKQPNLKEIERELKNLSLRDQQKLVAQMTQRLQQRKAKKKPYNWAKLYGLGKGLWKHEDAQAYVNRLREDRV